LGYFGGFWPKTGFWPDPDPGAAGVLHQPLRGPPPGAGGARFGISGIPGIRDRWSETSGDQGPQTSWLGRSQPDTSPPRGTPGTPDPGFPGFRIPTSPPRGVLHQPLAAGPCPRPRAPGLRRAFSTPGPERASDPKPPPGARIPPFPKPRRRAPARGVDVKGGSPTPLFRKTGLPGPPRGPELQNPQKVGF